MNESDPGHDKERDRPEPPPPAPPPPTPEPERKSPDREIEEGDHVPAGPLPGEEDEDY